MFEYLTFQELGLKGYTNEPAAFAAQKQGDVLLLTKTLADGSALQRKIQLTQEAVQFETTLKQKGEKPVEYQFRVHPEYYTGAAFNDSEKIGAFVKSGEWRQFNQDWKEAQGPNQDMLKDFQGGQFALYNHKSHYGILETFDPQTVEKLGFWWSDKYPMSHLDLYSKPVTLKPGEDYMFAYQISCIQKEPK